ncbi:unnamed protein product [Meloidogyne enterolobii]|uniref:Uncharacterized protein n=1 Tax=Meloidogyne enterolobii TaxID=390850 RepID=A0ACB0XUG1_MELEN
MPAYIYNCASPMFHFFIMIERVLATVYAKIYENQGKILVLSVQFLCGG